MTYLADFRDIGKADRLPGRHADPFDRLLVAQAQAEGLAPVSNEALFDHNGVSRVRKRRSGAVTENRSLWVRHSVGRNIAHKFCSPR